MAFPRRLLVEGEELVLDGDPARNLATFVTTWMEPEAQKVIASSLHRNFIDHAEYPRTAEIEQRCIRMLAHLFNAPGETTGARTQGSSEAIMLGALALKWQWRKRREAEGKATDRPNLVFGGDVHVVWEKFCRYFDVEPRIVPLQRGKYTIGPEDVEPHIDENTIGVAAVLGTTFTGHKDDIGGINDLLVRIKKEQGLDVEYLMLRAMFLPGKVTPEQSAFYVELFRKVSQTAEYKDYMEKQALKPIFLAGKDMLKFLEEDDKLNKNLMTEAGFVAQ